jgi:hypothetical protein
MKYSNYAVSYLIDVDTSKVILEDASRKKMRKIARKKYSKQYREEKTYVIVSGNSIKEAIANYKLEIAEKETRLETTLSKKTKKTSKKLDDAKKTKTKKTEKKQVATKKPSKKHASMLEEVLFEEEVAIKKLNKKNSK